MKTELPRIGQYELQQRLSRDTSGEVWKAYDSGEQRSVLLKLHRTHLPADTAAWIQYVHDVERVASLHHPNVVRLLDVHVLNARRPGSSSDLVCLVMEYVEGESLADYIERTSAVEKMPLAFDIVQLFSSIALALASAHTHGIIHGNLKPGNILLTVSTAAPGRLGTPLLTDFAATTALLRRQRNSMPFYLSPEQIKGVPADERSDVYALGAVLYELYTGGPPFRGNRPLAVMMQHINALPTSPDLVNPSISPAVTQVILRALAKDPRERFPNVALLVVTLAQALHAAVPEQLRHSALLAPGAPGFIASQGVQSVTPTAVQGEATRSTQRLPSTAGLSHTTLQASSFPSKRKRRSNALVIFALIALTLLLGASFSALLLLTQRNAASSGGIGQAFFLNSGQVNENSNQGINDELQVELADVPNPAPGKSYYAWLLGDTGQTEAAPIFLGHVTVGHGTLHFLYTGDRQHANLLGFASRFLINEDDAQNPSSDPLLDQSTWRYYAAIPQTPNPADALHFSMLAHLRHLLVEPPELAIRGLHGGLAFWFVRDIATVSDLANSLAADWRKQDVQAIHTQAIRILDYLDGEAFVTSDVPPGTPMLADAQMAQVSLLGPAPQDAAPPGYIYQNEAPPGYIYLIQMHMNGAVLSPQSTPQQSQLAKKIKGGIDTLKRWFIQMHQDARQLVQMTAAQLRQPPALTLLDDLATQAQYAYTGQPNPAAGASQGGVLWVYDNLQRLAGFNVAPYSASKR